MEERAVELPNETAGKLITNAQMKHALDNLPQASTTEYGAVKLVNDSELSEIKTGLTAGEDTDSIAITQGDVSCVTFEVTGSCSNKIVTLGGQMIISYSGAPVNNGDVVFKLPAGYRPSQQVDISIRATKKMTSSIVGGPYNFIIKTNGDVVYNDTSESKMYSINPGDGVNENPVTFEVGNYVPSDIVSSKLLTVPQMLDLFATNGGSSGGGLELLWEGDGSTVTLSDPVSSYDLLFCYVTYAYGMTHYSEVAIYRTDIEGVIQYGGFQNYAVTISGNKLTYSGAYVTFQKVYGLKAGGQ